MELSPRVGSAVANILHSHLQRLIFRNQFRILFLQRVVLAELVQYRLLQLVIRLQAKLPLF